jgi:ribosomal protein S6--L-glutamate ligase
MSRRGTGWKANRGVADYSLIPVPEVLAEWTRRAVQHLQADVLALDCLQTRDGEWFVLEYNDIPGLSGFPEEVRIEVARWMREKVQQCE